MKKTQENLYLLYMIFAIGLVTANAISSKIFNLGFSIFGNPATLTVGAICYPITFLVTDIIGEIWGKKQARLAVKFGFICQIIATIIIIIARYLPPVDSLVQESYVVLMGQNWVFVIASLSAFLVSQSWDVFVFHKIRDSYIKKHGSRKGGRWIWNNCSTISSQFIDSVIYVLIAFGLGFKWLFDTNMHGIMISMIVGQFVVKAILAILDTPIFYMFTYEKGEKVNGNKKEISNSI